MRLQGVHGGRGITSIKLTDVPPGPSTVSDPSEKLSGSSLSALHKVPPADPECLLPGPKASRQVLGLGP